MNPMNGPSGPASVWQEARNSDGRAYYYNMQTKATQWAKPVELMTPVEVRIHRKSHFLSLGLLLTRCNFILLARTGKPTVEGIHC